MEILKLKGEIEQAAHEAKSFVERSVDLADATFGAVKTKLSLLFEKYKLALKKQVVITSIIGSVALIALLTWPPSTTFTLLIGVGILLWWRILLSPIEILGELATKIPGAGSVRRFVEKIISQLFFSLLLVGIVHATNARRHPHLLTLLIILFILASIGSVGNVEFLTRLRHWITNRLVFWSLPLVISLLVVLHWTPESIKDFVSNLANRTGATISDTAGNINEQYTIKTLGEFNNIKKRFSEKTGEPNFVVIKKNDEYLIVRRQGDKPIFDPDGNGQLQVMDKKAVDAITSDLAQKSQPMQHAVAAMNHQENSDLLQTAALAPEVVPAATPEPTPAPEPDSQELAVVLDRFKANPQKEISPQEVCDPPPPAYSSRREQWEWDCRQKLEEAQKANNNGMFTGTLAQDAIVRGKHAVQSAPVQGTFEVVQQGKDVDVRMRVTRIETATGRELSVCTLTETDTIPIKKNLLRKIGAPAVVGAFLGALKTKTAKGALTGAVIGGGVSTLVSDLNGSATISARTPIVFRICDSAR